MTKPTETKSKKPRSKWRWLKRGVFAVVVLITLLSTVVVFENWRGRRAWAKYRAELEAKGEVLDWRKLFPQNIPDDQNFAKTPLLAPLMNYHRDPNTGDVVFDDPDAKQHLSFLFAWDSKLKTGNWRTAEKTDWKKIQTELRSQTNSAWPEIQALLKRSVGKPHDDVLFLFSLNKAEMDEISAAVKRPFSSFDTKYDEGIDTLMPQIAAIKILTRGFTLKPLAELAATNTESALADWETGVALGNALDGGPTLIGFLVKAAVINSTLKIVWEGLALHRWSDTQLVQIQNTLRSLNLVADAKRAFQGERSYNLVVLDQLLGTKGAGANLPGAIFRNFLFPGWVAQNKIFISRMYSDHLLPLLDSKNKRVSIAEVAAHKEKVASELKSDNPYRMMAKLLYPAISNSFRKVADTQNSVNMAYVACGLERHRLATGKHPENLDTLVPRYANSIPLDLDEQPLSYRLEPDGSFVLYSIGINLKDDNGRIGRPYDKETTDEGDWVWKYPTAAVKQDQ